MPVEKWDWVGKHRGEEVIRSPDLYYIILYCEAMDDKTIVG